MEIQPDLFILSPENEEQELVTGSSVVFRLTSSCSSLEFTPNVCANIKFKISGKFQSGKERLNQRSDLCGLSEDRKIFRIGFDLLHPGKYKVVVVFCDRNVTNSPFKFKVSAEVEMKDFKKVTEIEENEMESVLVEQIEDKLIIKSEAKICCLGEQIG